MTPDEFLSFYVDPGLVTLRRCTGMSPDDRARVMLVAIGGQETNLAVRRQQPNNGPARGWFQFESGGGVKGVMTHGASSKQARQLCDGLVVPFDQATVYEALAWSDPLAVGFARLLLWTDAAALPAIGDQDGAWNYYLRNWRPGKPKPDAWPKHYQAAVQVVSPHIS